MSTVETVQQYVPPYRKEYYGAFTAPDKTVCGSPPATKTGITVQVRSCNWMCSGAATAECRPLNFEKNADIGDRDEMPEAPSPISETSSFRSIGAFIFPAQQWLVDSIF